MLSTWVATSTVVIFAPQEWFVHCSLFHDLIFINNNEVFCYFMCLHITGESPLLNKTRKKNNFQILLIVCVISITLAVTLLDCSQPNAQSWLYLLPLLSKPMHSSIFWFSVQNTSSCLLTVSQTTKAPIYSAGSSESQSCLQSEHIFRSLCL